MLHFAILEHDWPFLHWDLLLEVEGEVGLRTWRLLSEPQWGEPIPAEPLPAHRRVYLTYEGPVSGNRGTVTCWDRGTHLLQEDGPGKVRVTMNGRRLQGELLLQRRDDAGWEAQFENVNV